MRAAARARIRLRTHFVVAAAQVALSVPALLWWRNSVLFVIGLSLFANFYAAVSAVEAADDSAVMARLDEFEELVRSALRGQSDARPEPQAADAQPALEAPCPATE